MNKKVVGVVVAVAVLGIAIGVFSVGNTKQAGSDKSTDSTEPVTIGLVLPLSGEAATYGEEHNVVRS